MHLYLFQLVLTRTKTLIFNLTNMGKTPFRYGWIYSEEQKNFKLTVSEKEGLVSSESRVCCKMNLTFLAKMMLENFEVTLWVRNLHIYFLESTCTLFTVYTY